LSDGLVNLGIVCVLVGEVHACVIHYVGGVLKSLTQRQIPIWRVAVLDALEDKILVENLLLLHITKF
jgi:hypothetical protein